MTETKKVIWDTEFDSEEKYPFCPYCRELAYEKDHCVFCGKPYEWVEGEGTSSVVEVGEYTVVQASNHHVHIIKNGKMVMHVPCNKPMTPEELKEQVPFYEKLITEKIPAKMVAKSNTYSAEYDITVVDENGEREITETVTGYLNIEAAKDDVESQIRILMNKNGIEKASLILSLIIIDPNGEYCEGDSTHVEYNNGTIHFEW